MYLNLTRCVQATKDSFLSDEERFDWQMSLRANSMLIDDNSPYLHIDIHVDNERVLKSELEWLNKGELVAGSFLCNLGRTSKDIDFSDIDIYFKSKEDAIEFCRKNAQLELTHPTKEANVAFLAVHNTLKFNLIFGVHYDSPSDLISRFDIRACSVAYDPNTNVVYSVRGAFDDCERMRIVYNPVPYNTTIARLVKYTQKGFCIDPYQRLFLAELIRSDLYNAELEITTGYRAKDK